jgi:prophage antirepressor-like protein
MSEITKIFKFEDGPLVRVVVRDGEPWFVATDVCKVLEIGNPSMAVRRLDVDDLSQIEVIDSLGRHQTAHGVSESGLYGLILRSEKPGAKKFKRWVTHEVLPSIRKLSTDCLTEDREDVNNMSEITKIFKFEDGTPVRVVVRDGEPWFVAADVAEVLGYGNPRDAVAKHCKTPEILTSQNATFGVPNRGLTIIPERDVYRLIMRSKLPAAERFEEWVVGEVLPSIRKHGAYMTPQTLEDALLSPDFLIRLATELKKEQEKNALLSQENTQIREENGILGPKAEKYDSLLEADGWMSWEEVAKSLNRDFTIEGEPVGRNRLLAHLRLHGFLTKKNHPKQEYQNPKHFFLRWWDTWAGKVECGSLVSAAGRDVVIDFLSKHNVLQIRRGITQ